MNKNAKAIKAAIDRRLDIAVILYKGAVDLERIDKALAETWFGRPKVYGPALDRLNIRKGRLEDEQAEFTGESEDLQKYVDKLLDPKSAWPEFDTEERKVLCRGERENIARYTKGKGFL